MTPDKTQAKHRSVRQASLKTMHSSESMWAYSGLSALAPDWDASAEVLNEEVTRLRPSTVDFDS